jgi:hypothetical protein
MSELSRAPYNVVPTRAVTPDKREIFEDIFKIPLSDRAHVFTDAGALSAVDVIADGVARELNEETCGTLGITPKRHEVYGDNGKFTEGYLFLGAYDRASAEAQHSSMVNRINDHLGAVAANVRLEQ